MATITASHIHEPHVIVSDSLVLERRSKFEKVSSRDGAEALFVCIIPRVQRLRSRHTAAIGHMYSNASVDLRVKTCSLK